MNDATNNAGCFVPTTFIWEGLQQLSTINVNSPEFKELLVKLYENLNRIVLALNVKDSAYYNPTEFVTGGLLFPNPTASASAQPQWRQIFRVKPSGGTLPNAGLLSFPHGILFDGNYTVLSIAGAATDNVGLTYLPLPYVSVSGDAIEMWVDSTNVNIITQSDRTNYTISEIVIMYVKY